MRQIQLDQEKQQPSKIEEPLAFTTFNTKAREDELTGGLNGQFLHSQLFINCLLGIKSTSADKNELFSLCKQEYQGNKKQLAFARKFQDEYSSNQALLWYTTNSFIHFMLNQALRAQDIHLIFLFRFLISDIKQQLKGNQCSSRLILYRGQFMWNQELESLKQSREHLISINSFLSTSLDRPKAYDFLLEPSDLERVLFEIDADPKLPGIKPFANISPFSAFPDEKEVLFMLGSIFRIGNITYDRNRVCTIKLTLCGDSDHDLETIFNHMKIQDEQAQLDLIRLGDVLRRMGKYKDAKRYYLRCLDGLSPDDSKNISACHYALGHLAESEGDYKSSLKHFQESLRIDKKILKPDDPNIAHTYNSLGNVYQTNGEYKPALESYDKALTIFRRAYGENHLNVAMCLNNMGAVCQQEKKYSEALSHYQNALFIRQELLPPNHPDLGASYQNIGIVHRHLGHSDQALEQYKLALKMYEKSLPPDHPDIAMTLENIGIVYEQERDWRTALSYYKDADNIYHKALSSTHPHVIQIEKSVRRVSSQLN
jgi:tetratricopeptide (TPR) repeat protein